MLSLFLYFFITDQGHNVGDIVQRIKKIHADNPSYVKPSVALIVDFSRESHYGSIDYLEVNLKTCGIPVSVIKPSSLSESALVAQSVSAALKGEMAIIDEILDTKLPTLPKWWDEIKK